MRFRQGCLGTALLATLATLALGLPALPVSAQSCENWTTVSSPNVADAETSLSGLAILAEDDVWSVGTYRIDQPGEEDQPFAVHWDGQAWSTVAVPNPAHPLDPMARLHAVDAVASNDIWAVGSFTHPVEFDWEPFAVHWDGSEWEYVPSPTAPTTSGARFFGVQAIATNDVWAVGTWPAAGGMAPLAAHWDGSGWEVAAVPYNPPGEFFEDSAIHDLAVISPDNIWGIGNHGGVIYPHQPYIVRWDGTEWSIQDPRPDPLYTAVIAIEALADDDVWVSAYKYNPSDLFGPFEVFLHFDGNSWTEFDSPGGLRMTAIASDDIWAAHDNQFSHWDGSSWSLVTEVPGLEIPSGTVALASLSPCEVWAAGYEIVNGEIETLTFHLEPGAASPSFVRGDGDGNGSLNGLVDGLYLLNAQFVFGSPQPPCLDAADFDDDGSFNGLSDAIGILSFQFASGPPPPPPFPGCGFDPSADALGCDSYDGCP